jgi:hypothetical protein
VLEAGGAVRCQILSLMLETCKSGIVAADKLGSNGN